MTSRNIWADGLGKAVRPLFDRIPKEQTDSWVRLATKHLQLSHGSTFLDCPCGAGRISLPLAGQGIRVTAFDVVPEYLEEIENVAAQQSLPITTQLGDMRDLPFKGEFDGAANFGSSFGLFKEENANVAVLRNAYRALKPGGRYMIDAMSRDWLARNFASVGLVEHDKGRMLQKRTFDFTASILTADWIYLHGAEEEHWEVTMRFYTLHELLEMFRDIGFVGLTHFGDFDENPIGFDTARMFIIGRKPE